MKQRTVTTNYSPAMIVDSHSIEELYNRHRASTSDNSVEIVSLISRINDRLAKEYKTRENFFSKKGGVENSPPHLLALALAEIMLVPEADTLNLTGKRQEKVIQARAYCFYMLKNYHQYTYRTIADMYKTSYPFVHTKVKEVEQWIGSYPKDKLRIDILTIINYYTYKK